MALTGQQVSRQVIIAVFPQLQSLNGCSVTPTERKHAERYLLTLATRRSCIHTEVDPEGLHAKRLEEIHQMGINENDEKAKTGSGAPSSIKVRIELAATCSTNVKSYEPKNIRLPAWLKVLDLKLMCQRMFGLATSQQRLLLSSRSMPVPIDMSEDDFSLDFYGLDEHCKIIVDDIK